MTSVALSRAISRPVPQVLMGMVADAEDEFRVKRAEHGDVLGVSVKLTAQVAVQDFVGAFLQNTSWKNMKNNRNIKKI